MDLFRFKKPPIKKTLTKEEALKIYEKLKQKDPTRCFVEDGILISDSEEVALEFERIKEKVHSKIREGKKKTKIVSELANEDTLLPADLVVEDLVKASEEGFDETRTFTDFVKQITPDGNS